MTIANEADLTLEPRLFIAMTPVTAIGLTAPVRVPAVPPSVDGGEAAETQGGAAHVDSTCVHGSAFS